MGLFKSKAQRRIERDIQVRQGLAQLRKQVKNLEKNEKSYIDKAKRAKRIGSDSQMVFLKKAIRQTISNRMMMERQMLSIETASQMKNQAESHAAFAKSMNAVSSAIGEVFGSVDLTKTQKNFEEAIAKAENMQERMDIFLEMSEGSMLEAESAVDESVISDEELDRLIELDGAPKVKKLDEDVEKGLEEIEKELS